MFSNFFSLNNPDFWSVAERFIINLVFLFLLLRVVYYRFSKKAKYLFGYFLMGIVIFFIGSMLKIVAMQFGMAIGLFAIFTILNLRTVSFNVKDMAYLFAVIAISAINSLDLMDRFPILGILIFNITIIASALILEISLDKKDNYTAHPIIYYDLEMLKPQNKSALIKNVTEMTGLDVRKVRIRRVNYIKKEAELDIFYKE
jgi:hypothetical protein